MALPVFELLLVGCLLLSLALLWRLCWFHRRPSHSRGGAIHSTAQRLLKPRTPLDCPDCRLACAHSSVVEPAPMPVRPWSEVKSRRGAPKRIQTVGFACPNRYSHWTWWINRLTLSRPTSGRFLVRRQSREAFSSRSEALSKFFC